MDDWKNLLRTVAPVLGTALGGPLGGAAASFIAGKLGIEEKTVESITKTLSETKLDPNQIAQIKLAEIEFNKFLKENEIDIEKVHAADRAGARDMLKATGSYVPASLTFVITIGYFTILIGMMLKWFTFADSQVMLMMLGQLGTAWGVCIAFWFGTTKNSQEKTNLLANSAPAK